MHDLQMHLEKLRKLVAECEAIQDKATEVTKKELFVRLAQHFKVLAGEIERALDGGHLGNRRHECEEYESPCWH
jgi:hypothetical protein